MPERPPLHPLTWTRIREELIPWALREREPIAALKALFRDTRNDGLVAEALGRALEERGRFDEALTWYLTAVERFPKPYFKERARKAADKVWAKIGARPPADAARPLVEGNDEGTLFVVSCTRRKAWDAGTATLPRYLPAEQAYAGNSMQEWRHSGLAARGARWLILSAKYGFIEPDHPIGDYDVTFSDPSTGPVGDATLAAQVAHQARWVDAVPLRSFHRVVVIGSAAYLARVKAAFAETSADVVAWPDGRAEGHDSAADSLAASRAEQVGRALGELPAAVYDSADRWDPEWPVLEQIAELHRGVDVLLTLALALSDYQLGVGGATAYWAEAQSLLERFPPDDAGQVYEFMFELMQRPVAARLSENKLRRVKRLIESEVPQLTSGGVESVDAVTLWPALAKAASADGDRNAKTIVFALKTLGLLHLAATGRRLALPEQLPIPVDLRVARVSLSAGLISPPPGVSVLEAIENVEPLIESNRVQMIEAWTEAAGNVGLSAAEIDSLIWQLGEPLYAHRHSRADAEAALQAHLHDLGAPGPAARAAAHELTHNLER